jgi:hypothetical protein
MSSGLLKRLCVVPALVALQLVGCGRNEQQPSTFPKADSAQCPVVRAEKHRRPTSLADHLAEIALQVRSELGDTVLPDLVPLCRSFDTLSLKVSSQLFMQSDPVRIVTELKRAVYQTAGVTFVDTRSDLRDIFPPTVLSRKRGSCLGISLVMLVLGERLDLPIYGVLVPGHFFVRFDNGDTVINIEPMKKGDDLPAEWYRSRFHIDSTSILYGLPSLTRMQSAAVAWYNVGNICRERKSTEAAARCYRITVEQLPGFAEAWGNLGIACQELGETQEALRCLEKARELDPMLKNVDRNIGSLKVRLAQHEKAIADFEQAVRKDSTSAEVAYGLAYACFGAGQYSRAAEFAQKALATDSGMGDARKLLARAMARMAGEQGK